MIAKFTKIEGAVVTGRSMGKLIGLSDRRVRQLADEGVIPRTEGGSYELTVALPAYINHLKMDGEIDKSSLDSFLQKEKALHEKAKREKAELILGQMRNNLHESQDVEKVMNEMLINFKTKLLSIPTKVAPQLIGYEEIPEVEEILRHEIYEVLKELSEYDPDKFKSDKYAEYDEDLLEEFAEGGGSSGRKKNNRTISENN